MTMHRFTGALLAALLLSSTPFSPAGAQAPAQAAQVNERGLSLPRFVSLKSSEGRARRGPARSYMVDWIFTRRDMPLMVTAEYEHWRRVEDSEGMGGWVHYALLSGVRTALVTGDMVPMRAQPRANASEVAHLERGVVARILTCQAQWCRLGVDGHRGWVERRALWGVNPHEWLD